MNKTTLKALKESIAHWKRFSTGNPGKNERPYSNHCALCAEFLHNRCNGCPVAEKCGDTDCVGSPYLEAEQAFCEYGINSDKFKSCALKELEFLQSLLPKRKVKR